MQNGFYNAMALANKRYKDKQSISYTEVLKNFISILNENQIAKISDWIPTNGNVVGINEDLSEFKTYTKNNNTNEISKVK